MATVGKTILAGPDDPIFQEDMLFYFPAKSRQGKPAAPQTAPIEAQGQDIQADSKRGRKTKKTNKTSEDAP